MTSQSETDTLSKGFLFIERFQALIKEANEAGFRLDVDVERNPFDQSEIEGFELDLYFGTAWVGTIETLDW